LPSPPVSTSAPVPPSSELLPTLPVSVSAPEPPIRFSMLTSVSLPAPPVAVPVARLAVTALRVPA